MNKTEKTYWLLLFLIFQTIGILSYYYGNNADTECGIIIDKYNGRVDQKHKSNVTLTVKEYLVVKYKSGYIKKHTVDSNTYYNHEINDNICLVIENTTAWSICKIVIAFDLSGFLILFIFIFFIYLVDKIRGKNLKYF